MKDFKLEARIRHLEKLLMGKLIKESYDEDDDLANLSDEDLLDGDEDDIIVSGSKANRNARNLNLPDFSRFRTVGDVLKSWSGLGTVGAYSADNYSLKKAVTRKLARAGVIDAAIRKNRHFTAGEAIDAVIDCWDDDLRGTAKLWWSNNDTVTVLDLNPIFSGRYSKLTLKLDWLNV